MSETQKSILVRAQEGESAAWQRLTDLYRPMILKWLRQCSVSAHDAEDLAQDILLTMIRALPKFTHSGRTGAFRSWLRTITVNRTNDFWRSRKRAPQATDRSSLLEMAQQLADPKSELSRLWDIEHDRYVLQCLLDLMALELEPTTLQAFRRVTLDGASPDQVAEELGISLSSVYVAKSRVLKKIRKEAAELLD